MYLVAPGRGLAGKAVKRPYYGHSFTLAAGKKDDLLKRGTRIETALLWLLAVAAAIVLSFRGIYEPDLWWHLAQGRETAAGRLVHTNVFNTLYRDFPQPYTSWLFDWLGYVLWRAAGAAAIQLAQAVLLIATFAGAYAACRQRASRAAALSILLIGFFVVEPRAIPRPHLVSFAGVAACAYLVERARATRSAVPLRWAVPLVAVWSNFHAESLFGPLVVGIFAFAELVRPSALSRKAAGRAVGIAILSALAMLANPYGWGLWRYLYENWHVPQVLTIAELLPPYLPNYRAFFVYLGLTAVSMLTPWRTLALSELAIAVLFGALGLKFLRFTPLLFLVTAPMVAERIDRLTARGISRQVPIAIAIVIGLTVSRQPLRVLTRLQVGGAALAPPVLFSPGLATFVTTSGLGGPVFNSMNLGGHLAWTLYPGTTVFQDGRLQAVPPDHFLRIMRASRSLEEWQELVAGVDWAVVSLPRPNQLSGAGMFQKSDWATVYWDEAVQVFVRRNGRFRPIAERDEYTLVLPDSDAFVLAEQFTEPDGARIRAEARRNMTENPDGFTAVALSCLAGDTTACDRADRLAENRPPLRDALARLHQARGR